MKKTTRHVLRSVFWYLRRPALYHVFAAKVRTNVKAMLHPAADRCEVNLARDWCKAICRETDDIIAEITGQHEREPFSVVFRDELARARRRQIDCPVRMGGPGNLDLLYHLAEFVRATRVIETGVAYGWSSLAILSSLAARPDSLLASTDMPYAGTDSQDHAGCVIPDHLKDRWMLIQRDDRRGLPAALERLPVIDLCHYDSDKSREGRGWAYPKLWHALRPGGVFISDDIGDNLAFREFCDRLGRTPHVVRTPQPDGDKFVGVLVKPTG